ncbi:MAG: hypothetical protein WCI18_08915 [Pseudomonadota bacterium]
MTEKETKTASEETENPTTLRRALFTAGPVALLAAFVTACSQDSAKFGGTTGRKDLRRTAGGASDGIGGTGGTGTDSNGDNAIGTNNTTGNVDVAQVPSTCTAIPQLNSLLSSAVDLPDTAMPTLKFYGSKSSLLLALGFPAGAESATFKLASVVLLDEDGYPLASHIISDANRSSTSGKLNLFSFDNLKVMGSKVHILVSTTGNQSYRKKDIPVTFDDPIAAGKTLVEVSPTKAAFVSGFQAVANFNHISPTSLHKKTAIFTGLGPPTEDDGKRFFFVADSSTQFVPAPGLSGFTIVDLLGAPLGSGDTFSSILQNSIFVAYKESGNSVYRTIIRMT